MPFEKNSDGRIDMEPKTNETEGAGKTYVDMSKVQLHDFPRDMPKRIEHKHKKGHRK